MIVWVVNDVHVISVGKILFVCVCMELGTIVGWWCEYAFDESGVCNEHYIIVLVGDQTDVMGHHITWIWF